MINIGILGSTRGSNMTAIHEAIIAGQLDAAVKIVISNKETAPILTRASDFGWHLQYLPPQNITREAYDHTVSNALHEAGVEWVVLIGYMRILSSTFIADWQGRIINVHPSLLPDFAGLMDLAVHRAVLAADKSETGCTVHIVTEEVDQGPILVQKKCAVLINDTPELLKARVQALEGEALVEAISKTIYLI